MARVSSGDSPLGAQKTLAAARRVTSHALLQGGREIIIEHGGREYRLRVTRQGKLILTA